MQNGKSNPSSGPEKKNSEGEARSPLSRRRFIAASAAAAVGAGLAGAALWPLYAYLSPSKTGGEAQLVNIPRSQVGIGQAHFFNFRGRPAVLLQPKPGEFLAFSAVCTHLGCIVQWRPEQEVFLCPCHAGTFSKTGKVISGPPPSPLPSYPVTVKGDQIVIG